MFKTRYGKQHTLIATIHSTIDTNVAKNCDLFHILFLFFFFAEMSNWEKELKWKRTFLSFCSAGWHTIVQWNDIFFYFLFFFPSSVCTWHRLSFLSSITTTSQFTQWTDDDIIIRVPNSFGFFLYLFILHSSFTSWEEQRYEFAKRFCFVIWMWFF